MSNDSTFVVQAEKVVTSDTVFYKIDKNDLKTLYEQAFNEMIDKEVARDHLMLTFTYVPLIIIFAILITLVNKRWNKAYKRVKDKQPVDGLSEEDMESIKKLDLQFYNLPDRLFFYAVVWAVAGIIDALMVLNNILDVPWAAIAAAIFTIWRILIRLVGGSTLKGINDRDLTENFGKSIKDMLVNNLTSKVKSIFNGLKS